MGLPTKHPLDFGGICLGVSTQDIWHTVLQSINIIVTKTAFLFSFKIATMSEKNIPKVFLVFPQPQSYFSTDYHN